MRPQLRGGIAFTGTLSQRRSDMAKLAMDAGFSVVDTVNERCKYLVKGKQVTIASSGKEQAARRHRVEIISEEEFLQLVADQVAERRAVIEEARAAVEARQDTEALRAYFR